MAGRLRPVMAMDMGWDEPGQYAPIPSQCAPMSPFMVRITRCQQTGQRRIPLSLMPSTAPA